MESEQFLSKDEFIKLYMAAKDDRERCLLQLMAGTGLRVGEISAQEDLLAQACEINLSPHLDTSKR
jgi:hypothetical protein